MVSKNKTNAFEVRLDLEKIEIEAWRDIYRSVSEKASEACGIQLIPAGLACAGAAQKIDILAFNRVIGLGIDKLMNENALDALIREYNNLKIPRFFVQLRPDVLTNEAHELLAAKGFYHYNNWVKLYRSTKPLPPAENDLKVQLIDSTEADDFADIVAESFGWPDNLKSLIVDPVGRNKWLYYMAYADEKPIATAALYISGEFGWIDMAATLSKYRGRGAQTLLVERRIIDAAAAGCKWLVVETAEDKPDKPAPSYRNMRRLGFEVAYLRPNYIYENKYKVFAKSTQCHPRMDISSGAGE